MRALISIVVLSFLTATAWGDLESLRSEVNIAVAAGEVDIATSKLRQILELAPDDGTSHYQMGTLLMDNDGDLFEASRHFERARELEFRPLGVAYRLSRIYASTGRGSDVLPRKVERHVNGFLVSRSHGVKDTTVKFELDGTLLTVREVALANLDGDAVRVRDGHCGDGFQDS